MSPAGSDFLLALWAGGANTIAAAATALSSWDALDVDRFLISPLGSNYLDETIYCKFNHTQFHSNCTVW